MSAPYIGDFPINGAVSYLWNTQGQDGASITRSTDGTLKIFKSNATALTWATERSSLSGVTQLEDFDATGVHSIYIDLSDNTDAGFYAAGNEYQVASIGAVVDTKTVNVPLFCFSIERSGGILALLKNGTYGLSALETLVDDLETHIGTPSDLGSGASVAANLVDIEGQTDDIGVAGAGLSAIPWNATWDAEVQSEVDDALDTAFTDATVLNAGGIKDRLRVQGWISRNKIEVTDANGNTVIYKDDSITSAFTVAGMLTDDSTTTTRLRAA